VLFLLKKKKNFFFNFKLKKVSLNEIEKNFKKYRKLLLESKVTIEHILGPKRTVGVLEIQS
jgi:hypothetical protein